MEADDHDKHLENTATVFCFRNGSLFCHQKTNLETIVFVANPKNTGSTSVWNTIYSPYSCIHMAVLLPTGNHLLSLGWSFVVFEEYLRLCDLVIPFVFLFEKESKRPDSNVAKKDI